MENKIPHCSVCGDGIALEKELKNSNYAECCKCDTPYHRQCYEFNGKCAIYGCESTISIYGPKKTEISDLVKVEDYVVAVRGTLETLANDYLQDKWVKTYSFFNTEKKEIEKCLENANSKNPIVNFLYKSYLEELDTNINKIRGDYSLCMTMGLMTGMIPFAQLGVQIIFHYSILLGLGTALLGGMGGGVLGVSAANFLVRKFFSKRIEKQVDEILDNLNKKYLPAFLDAENGKQS